TFMATMSVIHHVGATPVLVDVGDDHNMNVDLVEAAITPRTKAIMPVYLNGRLCRMDRLMEIAKAHDLLVLEDTAQALGGAYDGERAGLGTVRRPPAPNGGPYCDIDQNYVIEAVRRDDLASHLAGRGIETLISPGPIPNHKQPVGLDHFHLPKTETLCARVL